MTTFKHILFPVDFSDRCVEAVPFVDAMARNHGARLTLLTVAHPFYAQGFEGAPTIDPQQMTASLRDELNAWMDGAFKDLPCERIAQSGDPANCIIDFVKTQRVDLVMMPSHGYGPFRQLLLGSVTAKVLHDVACPVWTMAHTEAAPSSDHMAARKILCAVDTTPPNAELIRRAADLAKSTNASLRLIHAVPGIEAWPERQLDQEFEQQMRENARCAVIALEKSADVNVPVCVGAGTVPDVVREEALQHGADLVVIGRGVLQEKLGRLRTHAHGIIRHSPCPVLSF